MLETSARLLRLLSLLQTPRSWTGAELAERLEVDVRTVRRDVDKLRTLGYPVEASSGVAGYRLGAGAELPPLLLEDEEAVAVAVGLRTAAGGTIAGIEDSSLRALTKLEQVLPSRLRHRVNLLHSVTVAVPAAPATVDPDTLTAIAGAIRDNHRLRFDYRTHTGVDAVRTTEPHRLVHTGRRWYLLGWDVDRADWRTYRVDRMHPRVPTGPRFTPREAPSDIADYVGRGVTTSPYRYAARVTLLVPAEVAADRIAPTVGVVEPIDERSCLLTTGANSVDELAFYLGAYGFPFRVHEPPELVARIGEIADMLRAAVD
ncbi:helix-turn-helix transcriptional regulator [Nocardia bovistercoris]|uniref:YafY family transcriptional regulator n=1 Tax=Nocardia bovistercoris TaxID=2785916 RepID=A0A931I9K2_9NOCA|nr:YafY family protein [Nocardia bovistercoris]MBH0776222.1 YafY family transcriptional regulator [Nocardia bovistercoris]